jgi:cytochrome c peroxidase
MDSARSEALPGGLPAFHNTGLYDEDGLGAYPATDQGLLGLTGDPADMGRFRAPSLRNAAVTAPYMHDGSVATLSGVIDHYAAGGRSTLARGAPSPLRDPRITGFALSADERGDLLAFLEALTDEALLVDPRFGPP